MEEPKKQKQENRKKVPDKGLKDYARYSGLAFQMAAIILVCTWGGTRLDTLTEWQTPVFTIILSLLGVFAGIYLAVKDFIK